MVKAEFVVDVIEEEKIFGVVTLSCNEDIVINNASIKLFYEILGCRRTNLVLLDTHILSSTQIELKKGNDVSYPVCFNKKRELSTYESINLTRKFKSVISLEFSKENYKKVKEDSRLSKIQNFKKAERIVEFTDFIDYKFIKPYKISNKKYSLNSNLNYVLWGMLSLLFFLLMPVFYSIIFIEIYAFISGLFISVLLGFISQVIIVYFGIGNIYMENIYHDENSFICNIDFKNKHFVKNINVHYYIEENVEGESNRDDTRVSNYEIIYKSESKNIEGVSVKYNDLTFLFPSDKSLVPFENTHASIRWYFVLSFKIIFGIKINYSIELSLE